MGFNPSNFAKLEKKMTPQYSVVGISILDD